MNNLGLTQEICNTTVDYSSVVTGNRILPFVFELDLPASILNPQPGQNQRFCYNVTGVGQDTATYGDLSHFVLGICPDITEDQLDTVTVIIDGVRVPAVIGEDVEIFNPPRVDPPTGCSGLKFDFGLDKVDGEMTVCFELNVVYPIAPTELCLFGANETKKGLEICGPVCNGEPVENSCSTDVYVPATVCTEVTITPFVHDPEPTTFCCGKPRISVSPTPCPGTRNGNIRFTVSQDICVNVPLEFGAVATVGDPFVQGGEPTTDDICTDCDSNTSR